MLQRQTEPAVIQPLIAPEGARAVCQQADSARDAALQRVCAGFTTTISPRSAARLADLLSASTYVQAA
ncbi:hypothetical protein [Streptomyces sp. I6]|uniref:hypothetical protein n=1 Tax=Streptomyces sp. I6 TaxID=2483113 RepID=UPI000F448FB1|nr:hypothetical protein [Streptomyces sp. I6]RNL72085.1 hypothetical protein EBF04_15835 [Streptomyces sp. I6]